MAELVYAVDSKSAPRKRVWVRAPVGSLELVSYMVFVVERFRRKIVVLVYAGSSPVKHPNGRIA